MADEKPPQSYRRFISTFPELGAAWNTIRDAEGKGPLDSKAQRLLKLAVAAGAMREGAVHSAARKALAAGATREELEQVVALSASTLGLPSAVAIHTWICDVLPSDEG